MWKMSRYRQEEEEEEKEASVHTVAVTSQQKGLGNRSAADKTPDSVRCRRTWVGSLARFPRALLESQSSPSKEGCSIFTSFPQYFLFHFRMDIGQSFKRSVSSSLLRAGVLTCCCCCCCCCSDNLGELSLFVDS
jgi:hypothetical protein